jgi:hypothetical protein
MLTPAEIGRQVVALLVADNLRSVDAYRTWVKATGGYRLVDLSDTSRWGVRLGNEKSARLDSIANRTAPFLWGAQLGNSGHSGLFFHRAGFGSAQATPGTDLVVDR